MWKIRKFSLQSGLITTRMIDEVLTIRTTEAGKLRVLIFLKLRRVAFGENFENTKDKDTEG